MRTAEVGIAELAKHVDTLIVIPNQNLFLVASEKTTFADAFMRADDVLKSGVSCITDLMVKEGLINLDFADVRTVMQNMGTALMGTGEAEGEKRALQAAEAAISNPLLGEVSMRGAKGLLVSITGSFDMIFTRSRRRRRASAAKSIPTRIRMSTSSLARPSSRPCRIGSAFRLSRRESRRERTCRRCLALFRNPNRPSPTAGRLDSKGGVMHRRGSRRAPRSKDRRNRRSASCWSPRCARVLRMKASPPPPKLASDSSPFLLRKRPARLAGL